MRVNEPGKSPPNSSNEELVYPSLWMGTWWKTQRGNWDWAPWGTVPTPCYPFHFSQPMLVRTSRVELWKIKVNDQDSSLHATHALHRPHLTLILISGVGSREEMGEMNKVNTKWSGHVHGSEDTLSLSPSAAWPESGQVTAIGALWMLVRPSQTASPLGSGEQCWSPCPNNNNNKKKQTKKTRIPIFSESMRCPCSPCKHSGCQWSRWSLKTLPRAQKWNPTPWEICQSPKEEII